MLSTRFFISSHCYRVSPIRVLLNWIIPHPCCFNLFTVNPFLKAKWYNLGNCTESGAIFTHLSSQNNIFSPPNITLSLYCWKILLTDIKPCEKWEHPGPEVAWDNTWFC
jgi:hypothetical protein